VVKGFIEQHDVEFIDTCTCGKVRLSEDNHVRSSQNGFGIASVGRQDRIF
jgi:hypothetical protein